MGMFMTSLIAWAALTGQSGGAQGGTAPAAAGATGAAKQFDSPEAVVAALKIAVAAKDKDALKVLFGPDVTHLTSGEPDADKENFELFARRLDASSRIEKRDAAHAVLYVGRENHPFAVPIVSDAGRWFFDTPAGIEEITDRRIGSNELDTLRVCRGYVEAQREYFSEDRDGDNVLEYAQRVASAPGQHDGLYWETGENEPPSPLGALVAEAGARGRAAPNPNSSESRPYHGYVFRILTRQGKNAPGGAYDYVINGNMVAGYALLATPAEWDRTGIMTFLVGPNGKVYQKDLGEKSAELTAAMDSFDVDATWTVTND